MTKIGSYTTASDPLTFTIDGHECAAAGKLPADTFVEFVGILGQLGKQSGGEEGGDSKVGIDDIGDTIKLLSDAVRICCTPETAEFITAGMSSATNPIDLDMIQEILSDLMAAYGMAAPKDENGDEVEVEVPAGERPTQRTSESETGSAPTEGSSGGD